MGLLDKIKAKPDTPTQSEASQLKAQAHPIAVNPRAHAVIFRQLSRLARLYSVKNHTADIQEAIEVCLAHLRVHGVRNPPRNGAEVQRFINAHSKGA